MKQFYLYLGVFFFSVVWAQAQIPGQLDDFLTRSGADDAVSVFALQKDGKVLAGGKFTAFHGKPFRYIVRLNENGFIDESFNPGNSVTDDFSDFFTEIDAIAVQADGKILIGGEFTAFDNVPRNRIARLNPDGSLDESFDPGEGADNTIRDVEILPDGKILIGGGFANYDGTPIHGIARLNADGSLDESFSANPNSALIFSIDIQEDDKILIGGNFTQIQDASRNYIARLNADGSLDESFAPAQGPDDLLYSVAIQDNGKILMGGIFDTVDGIARKNIARLNADGSLDETLDPGTGANLDIVQVTVLEDQKILIVGRFFEYNTSDAERIARLNADGSLDETFEVGSGANFWVLASLITEDGRLFLGGVFSSFDGVIALGFKVLNTDGSSSTVGANNLVISLSQGVDNTFILGGAFTTYNGRQQNRIARINVDGSLDERFAIGSGANDFVFTTHLQQDGKLLVGGAFTTFNNLPCPRIIRLNEDGSTDESFAPGEGANDWVFDIETLQDGKIILVGFFTRFQGEALNYIVRLNPDGSVDDTFNPGTGSNSRIRVIKVLEDGKLLIGGDFTAYNGVSRNYIARLNPDGSLDTTFNPGEGANFWIRTLEVQPDGKILAGGDFTAFDNQPTGRIARLNPDGSLDLSFDTSFGANERIRSITVQEDGNIVIAGNFTGYNGAPRAYLTRLKENGTLDENFPSTAGANGEIFTSLLQDNGQLLLGGGFTTFNDRGRFYIARIFNTNTIRPKNLMLRELQDSSFVLRWDNINQINQYEVDVSLDESFGSFLPGYFNRLVQDTTVVVAGEGIVPGERYYCRVRALNQVGVSAFSQVLEVIPPPIIPINIEARATSSTEIIVSWDFIPGTLYQVETAVDSSFNFTNPVILQSGRFSSVGLRPGTTYFFRVRAQKNGVFSDFSPVIGATTFNDIITSTEAFVPENLMLYPNPNDVQMTIAWKYPLKVPQQVYVMNSLGEIEYTMTVKPLSKQLNIPLTLLKPGIYLLKIQQGTRWLTKKIIKH